MLRAGDTQHPHAPSPRVRRNHVHQHGLANPGVAGDQDRASVVTRLLHERPEQRDIPLAPDEKLSRGLHDRRPRGRPYAQPDEIAIALPR
jgi:hypothetical protein